MASKPLILITGANQGLGYYATQQLAATGIYHILLGSRNMSKAEKAIESLISDQSFKVNEVDLTPIQIDVTDDESINAAAARVEYESGSLGVLPNNAGIATAQSASAEQTSREACLEQFDTNVTGAAAVADAFLPLLQKSRSKRIAFVSAGLCSLQKTDDGPQSVNKTSIYYYARTLENRSFVVSAPAPGFCATNLNNHSGKKDPRDDAKLLLKALLGEKEDVHGRVFSEPGREPR